MPKRPKHQNQTPLNAPIPATGDMQFWKEIGATVVKTKKGWAPMEAGTVLQEVSQLLGRCWKKIDKVINEAEDKSASFSLSVNINRASIPPEVSVKIGGSQTWSDRITVKVPDPDQNELPLEAGATEKED